MYNFQIAQKRQKEAQSNQMTEKKEQRWLKRYKTEVKPKLLEHYDARLKAFIRQIEEEPEDPSRILKNNTIAHYPAFKFKLYETTPIKDKSSHHSSTIQLQPACSILRSSNYCPISEYQFRKRQREKEIKPKVNMKLLIYRKKQKQQHLISISNAKHRETMKTNRISTGDARRRSPEDNRSEIPSICDDNQSIRFSNHDNIEKQARQYEKNQELIEKKLHYKKLATLEQTVQDTATKKALHGLLVKGGQKRPRMRTEYKEVQIDFLKNDMYLAHND